MGLVDNEIEARAVREEGGIDRLTDPVTLADAVELAACVARTAQRSSCGFAPTE